jgi:triosephosphate isomerase
MKKPILVINAKTYPQATGKGAIKLANACDQIINECGVEIALCLQPFDLQTVSDRSFYVKIFAQHLDPCIPGRNTGFLVPQNVKKFGISGSILNHSEHKLEFPVLKKTVQELKKQKMKSIICANTPSEAKKVAALKPDFVAIEPPKLIGGEVSVSDAKPNLITDAVKAVGKVPLLVGAGIADGHDVQVALEHGAVGILAASHVAKAKNPKKVLRDLSLS